jgi:hypothetical protein
VHVDEVGVGQGRGGPSFTFEAKPELGLPGLGGLKHLHGDGAPQRSLLRLIDGGHGALPEDFLDDEIVTQRVLLLV